MRDKLNGPAYGLAIWAASYLGWIPAAGILTPATKHPMSRNLLSSPHTSRGAQRLRLASAIWSFLEMAYSPRSGRVTSTRDKSPDRETGIPTSWPSLGETIKGPVSPMRKHLPLCSVFGRADSHRSSEPARGGYHDDSQGIRGPYWCARP
ncbi:hypothetical protein CN171_25130 [Sinorhizobium meliloti]|nr:hypothetical protein CN171_25130 [Sinorhizobium meliloti]RVJ86078.1 hypothetical protein CN169_28680 [Sinorhizobium meliloti]